MAKKGATQSLNAEPKAKQSVTDRKSKERKGDQKKGKKSISGGIVDDEEQWEDKDSEDDKKVAPKSNGSKIDNRQHGDEESSHEDGESEDSEDDEDQGGIDIAGIDDSDSESELGSDGDGDREDKDDAEEEEEEEEIDVDELISDLDEEDEENIAAGTRTRQTIYNKEGLLAALRRFALDTNPKTVPFAFHQSVVSSKRTEESIPSVEDDLQRELAFVNQSLEAARQARTLLRKEGVPFTRPTDYFAETVRSDATMEKVKAKLIEEATAKKAAAEARKQRDLKKFGKQVQVQKQQERAKQKREALDKINLLKRKRQEGGSSALGTHEADDIFDVAVDNELASQSNKSSKKRSAGDHGQPNPKRQKKNAKYGFGGKKRFSKSGDAMSSGDLSGFSAKRMKSGGSATKKVGKAPRPGKSRRKAMAAKR